MIPRVINYCWFGHNPLPESAKKCIKSWQNYFPDYLIKEWNEDNFDVNIIPYTRQAYEAKKYAFVSDFARFWILYHYGGLYFDTDVEVIRPMDDIIERGAYMGIEVPVKKEKTSLAAPGVCPGVNPGLGMAVPPYLDLIKVILENYSTLSFKNLDGSLNQTTIVEYTSAVLMDMGLQPSNSIQLVAGVWIYPSDFFNPLDSLTGKLKITNNTRSIHWYMNSWSDTSKSYKFISRLSHRLFGTRLIKMKKSLSLFLNRNSQFKADTNAEKNTACE